VLGRLDCMVVALHRRRLQSFTYVLANLAVIGAKRVGLLSCVDFR